MEKQTIIIVDDSVENLRFAHKESLDFFVERGFDVFLTDNAQEALNLIEGDSEKKVIGVVTDLLFPRGQHFSAYDSFLRKVEECAEKVFCQMIKSKPNSAGGGYIARLKKQFELLCYGADSLPYGGGIALACIDRYIPFVIVTDTHRHVLSGQSLDTATLLTPFCDLGFLELDNLTESRYSRHAMWAADKRSKETWLFAFKQISAQFGEDKVFGKSTWSKYCDPALVREPEITSDMLRGIQPGKVSAKVSAPWDGDRAISKVADERALKIVRENKYGLGSTYTEEEQADFISKVLIKMGMIDDTISKIKAQGFIWIAGEGKVRLPPHSWWDIIYRPDIGMVVAISKETIDRAKCHYGPSRGGYVADNQLRFKVLVWKINEDVDNYNNIYSITYWDYGDDLEPPEIKSVTDNKVVINQFVWSGEDNTEHNQKDIVATF
ncbi:MAG: hypothetical protein V1867_00820 [Candidatus Falkowbacteria bacterium]